MTDETMSPLRRRMIEDMTIRKFAPKTQRDNLQGVKNFAAFLKRLPDVAVHLSGQIRRHEIVEHTHVIHELRKLPALLRVEEVARLLNAVPGIKYEATLSVAYGAGLRAAEVVSFEVADIESRRMLICVGSRAKPARTAT